MRQPSCMLRYPLLLMKSILLPGFSDLCTGVYYSNIGNTDYVIVQHMIVQYVSISQHSDTLDEGPLLCIG